MRSRQHHHAVRVVTPSGTSRIHYFRDKAMALRFAAANRTLPAAQVTYLRTAHGPVHHYTPEDWRVSHRVALKSARRMRRTRARRSR